MADRNSRVDIIKGIGIILVVIGHCNLPGRNFIYLFHMPLFFMASGYFYSFKNAESISAGKHFLWQKIKRLWFPCFIIQSISLILNNYFIEVGVYITPENAKLLSSSANMSISEIYTLKDITVNIVKTFFFLSGTYLTGPFWFVKDLFLILILINTISLILVKLNYRYKLEIQMFISIIFLVVGYYFKINNGNQITSTFFTLLSTYGLVVSGFLLKNYGFQLCIERLNPKKRGVLILLSLISLVLLSKYGSIELSANQYINPIFLLISSLAGWMLTYLISDIIFSKFKTVNILLCYVGKNSMQIFLFHLISFKLVTYLQVLTNHDSRVMLASYPVYKISQCWWIVYIFFGVAIPLIIDNIYHQIIKRIVIYKKLGEINA